LLAREVQRAKFIPTTIKIGADLNRELLTKVNDGILEAAKIIALLTPDEEIRAGGSGVTHMARPNVYLELGLVGAQRSTLRKAIILLDERVAFPSDFGGKEPLRFRNTVAEVFADLEKLLND
jgi:predicted nucleotide-binding protein